MSKAVIRPISIGLKKDSTKSAFLSHLEAIDKEVEEGGSLSQLEQDLLIDLTEELTPPVKAWGLTINDTFFTCGTKGDFSVIIGKAKSKKTFLLSIILEQILKEDINKHILYFDTEQDKYHASNSVKRIVKKIGTIPSNLKAYTLRGISPSERLEFIDSKINNSTDIDIVIIDGVRDLVSSINDEEQATKISTKLLNWTANKELHIITIIHQNKGDNNARGHLGTELMNKSQLVLSVLKDVDNERRSFVKKELDRSAPDLPDFSFSINENGLADIEGITSKKSTSQNSNKLGLHDIKDETWKEILPRVFKDNTGLKYNDLVTEIRVDLESKFNVSIGRNRIVDHITNLRNKGFIDKIGKAGSRNTYYILSSI